MVTSLNVAFLTFWQNAEVIWCQKLLQKKN